MGAGSELEPAAPTRCAWCGRELDRTSERLPGRIRCACCGAATTDPWPSAEALERAYADWYRPPSGRFSGPGDWLLRGLRGTLARRIHRIAPEGPVLDVGAGDGTLLRALEGVGREALGLEREGRGEGIVDRSIRDVNGEWAAVVFWHTLEHLREPGSDFDHAARLLAPSGVLVIAVPNSDSIQARAFGRRWFALDPPRHLVHLPARALVARAESQGLRVERTSHLRGGQVVFGWLHGLVALLPGSPDLYTAIRRAPARAEPLAPVQRIAVLAGAALLLAPAVVMSVVEAALGRGGSVYMEARRG